MKEIIKRFYSNVNSKTVESMEEIATEITPLHNTLIETGSREAVILTRQYPLNRRRTYKR